MYCLGVFMSVALHAAYVAISWCFLVGLYHILLHPLRHYPGPLTAKICDLYGAFYAAKTNLHQRTLRDHQLYGSVVRHGPNKLVFNSAEALRDIYQNDSLTKSRAYLVAQRMPGTYGLFNTIDRGMHQRKRKLVSQVLNERSMRRFEPIMIAQVDIFLRQLLLSCGPGAPSSVNMTTRFRYLTLDIMGHLAFSYPLNLQTDTTYRAMANTTTNYFLNIAMQLPFLSQLRILSLQSLRTLLRGEGYIQALESMVKSCLAQGQHTKHDLLFLSDTLKISEDDATWMREIRSESIFLLTAGSDTTSALLSALFFHLSRNPPFYQRLCEEIRSSFGNGNEIQSGTRLANCSYLRACLDEALRMFPPIPGTLWREQAGRNSKTKTIVIDGHVIPPGTQIGVNTYALHHNELYFPEPFVFKPERWLTDGKAFRGAFAPFSLGGRSCIGRSMAYLEASIIVAKTLWYFDFEPALMPRDSAGNKNSESDEFQLHDTFAAAHDGPFLKFHPRESLVQELKE